MMPGDEGRRIMAFFLLTPIMRSFWAGKSWHPKKMVLFHLASHEEVILMAENSRKRRLHTSVDASSVKAPGTT